MSQRRALVVMELAACFAVFVVAPVDAADAQPSPQGGGAICTQCPDVTLVPSPSPSDGTPTATMPSMSSSWNTQTSGGLDFLVAGFFLIAAGWLVLALAYSFLVLTVMRLRARGELDIYDENFGRIYLCGTRCYIPLGCILRRYVIAIDRADGSPVNIKIMTREERRAAMELILASDSPPVFDESHKDEEKVDDKACATRNQAAKESTSILHGDDMGWSVESGLRCEQEEEKEDTSPLGLDSTVEEAALGDVDIEGLTQEPTCSVCLMEYEETDICFTPTTCPHRFHRQCIMEWLERRSNTECPCCRVPMVTEDEVWKIVQKIRKDRRKQHRREQQGRRVLERFRPSRFVSAPSNSSDNERQDVTASTVASSPPDESGVAIDDIEQQRRQATGSPETFPVTQ